VEVLARRGLANLPLRFEPVRGQASAEPSYVTRGSGYAIGLTARGARFRWTRADAPQEGARHEQRTGGAAASGYVQIEFVGGNPHAAAAAGDTLPGTTNYLLGNDPKQWRTDVPSYARLRYEAIYPGIDLVYYGKGQELEHDWIVAPGADPRSIKLAFDGADAVTIDSAGDLVLRADENRVRLRKPVVYQSLRGTRREVAGSYVLDDRNRVSFDVGSYDPAEPLVIDPILSFATYLGGSATEDSFPDLVGGSIAVDDFGSIYVTGMTGSGDFPIANALQPRHSGSDDVFVVKLNPSGTSVIYSTFIGGKLRDLGRTIKVDAFGNVYVVGITFSPDFPTSNSLKPALGGEVDAFVFKLNPRGSGFVFSTLIGGSAFDVGFALSIDDLGEIYVGGRTQSIDFPLVNAVQTERRGASDAWVAKLNRDGSAMTFSTYFGGEGDDWCFSLAVDSSHQIYFTGQTNSSTLTTKAANQPEYGGALDAYVAKLDPERSTLVYSTYLGGTGDDRANSICLDTSGNAYITGYTHSADFPISNGAYQPKYGGAGDAFVTELDSLGGALLYSTYLGGSGTENVIVSDPPEPPANSAQGFGNISIDKTGNIYVSGATASKDFPLVEALQSTNSGLFDVFITKWTPTMGKVVFSTYFGGFGNDTGNSTTDPAGNIYVTGYTSSADLPITLSAPQRAFAGFGDSFVAKFKEADLEPQLSATLNQTEYKSGDSVTIQELLIKHTGNGARKVELKVWLSYPDRTTVSVLNIGSDGSLSIPGNFTQNLGSTTLFTIDSNTQSGMYIIGMRIADPITLAILSEDFKAFAIP
jgi:hypothetical protein